MKWLIFIGAIILFYVIKGLFFMSGVGKEKQFLKSIDNEKTNSWKSYLNDDFNSIFSYIKSKNLNISNYAVLSIFIYSRFRFLIRNWTIDDSIYLAYFFDSSNDLINFLVDEKILIPQGSDDAINQIMGKTKYPVNRTDVVEKIKTKLLLDDVDKNQLAKIKKEITKNKLDSKDYLDSMRLNSTYK